MAYWKYFHVARALIWTWHNVQVFLVIEYIYWQVLYCTIFYLKCVRIFTCNYLQNCHRTCVRICTWQTVQLFIWHVNIWPCGKLYKLYLTRVRIDKWNTGKIFIWAVFKFRRGKLWNFSFDMWSFLHVSLLRCGILYNFSYDRCRCWHMVYCTNFHLTLIQVYPWHSVQNLWKNHTDMIFLFACVCL